MLLVLLQLEWVGFYQSCLLHGSHPPNNLGRGLAQNAIIKNRTELACS